MYLTFLDSVSFPLTNNVTFALPLSPGLSIVTAMWFQLWLLNTSGQWKEAELLTKRDSSHSSLCPDMSSNSKSGGKLEVTISLRSIGLK